MASDETDLLDQDDQWEFMFLEMTRFQDREGHCTVPLDHEENGALLGLWLQSQRLLQKHDLLPIERYELLDELGVNWQGVSQVNYELPKRKRNESASETTNTSKRFRLQEKHVNCGEATTNRQRRWEAKFSLLRQFKEREGHCNLPQTYTSAEGHRLGYWLSDQKHRESIGKLDLERKERLEQLGVEWCTQPSEIYNRKWEKMFQILLQYMEREGHCNVPQRVIEKGFNLGKWLRTQRQMERIGKLDPKRRERLDQLGVTWLDPVVFDRRAHWEQMFFLLSQFKEREGHCRVPIKAAEKGLKLGQWLYHQKYIERLGRLDWKRQARLEKLGVSWLRDQQNMSH